MPRVAPEASVIRLHAAGARHRATATAGPAEFVALLGETDGIPTESPTPQSSTPLAAASSVPGSIEPAATTASAQPIILAQIVPEDADRESQSVITQPPALAATADTEGRTEVREEAFRLEPATIPAIDDAKSAIDDAKSAETDTTGLPVATSDAKAPPVAVTVAPAHVVVIAAPLAAALPVPNAQVGEEPALPVKEPVLDRAAIIAELAAANSVAMPQGAGTAAVDSKSQPPRKGATGLNGIEAPASGNDATVHAKPGGATDDAPSAGGPNQQDEPRAEAHSGPSAHAAGKSEVAHGGPIRPVGPEPEPKLDETSIHLSAQTPADGAADRPASQLAVPQQAGERTANVVPAPAPAAAYTSDSIATAVPIAGLALQIAARAQAGNNRFEIRLDPPELGRIDVRLDVDREGRVSSRLVAEKAETLELLRREAPELERALQQAGLKTSDNGMQFTLRDQSFGGANQGSTDGYWRSSAAKLVVPDPEMAAADGLPGNSDRALRLGAGIDIRV